MTKIHGGEERVAPVSSLMATVLEPEGIAPYDLTAGEFLDATDGGFIWD